jgi:AraC-like DNA-binding protein
MQTMQRPDKTSGAPMKRYRSNERLMFITPKRIAYAGLLGTPGTRIFGATTLYLSLRNPFQLWQRGSNVREARFAIVPAYVPHRVATRDRSIAEVLLEAESVPPALMIERFAGNHALAEQTADRAIEGFRCLRENWANAGNLDFDALFFNEPPPLRKLDPRIAVVAERISRIPAEKHPAEACAEQAGLSFSRFTHLFCEQMGTTLRRFRAWKRARGVMHIVHGGGNLLEAALNSGYADSTHFSHSLRQFYGLPPKDIFSGARGLAVFQQMPCSGNLAPLLVA